MMMMMMMKTLAFVLQLRKITENLSQGKATLCFGHATPGRNSDTRAKQSDRRSTSVTLLCVLN